MSYTGYIEIERFQPMETSSEMLELLNMYTNNKYQIFGIKLEMETLELLNE